MDTIKDRLEKDESAGAALGVSPVLMDDADPTHPVLAHILAEDERRVQTLIKSLQEQQSKDVYAWLPLTVDIVRWFRVRTAFFAEALYPERLHPFNRPVGFYSPQNSDFILLFHDLRYSNLYVLRHSLSDRASAAALVRQCLRECAECQLNTFVVWDPSELMREAIARLVPAEYYTRERIEGESIPSLMLYRDRLPPVGDTIDTDTKVHWLANEKYCWI